MAVAVVAVVVAAVVAVAAVAAVAVPTLAAAVAVCDQHTSPNRLWTNLT